VPDCDGCKAALRTDSLQLCPCCPGNRPSFCQRCHVRHMLQAHLGAVAEFLAGPVGRLEVERYAWEALRLMLEPYGLVFFKAVAGPRITVRTPSEASPDPKLPFDTSDVGG